jgi:hypothetical protein
LLDDAETNRIRESSVKKASLSLFVSLACFVCFASAAHAENSAEVDFARDVLPILSNKCFVCHGPDTHDETDLRLDSLDAATSDRGGYRAIDPDDPSKSEILVRIHSADDPMPPRGVEKQLTEAERELISRWVKQGGTYARHWAFVPPHKEAAYDTTAQAIDAYVGQQLEKKGIDFAPEAERSTLARRVSLALTGLPPEPQLLDEYLTDESQSAYEKLIDRLLDSPRFGEHQARYWLDAVRYGDTHGLHLDNRRGIYPYRDWVVRAFNDNLPLDDFILWQIAGDLLPNASLEQRVATGYVRMNPSTGEGGAISEEFQMKNNFDRVETLGTVFLGMSLTCARCHTHKYDPIEQTEYYRLLAFFNSTAEPALDGNSYTYGPVAKVPADQDAWQQWRTLSVARDELLASADETIDDLTPAIEYAVARAGWSSENWRISKPAAVTDYTTTPEDEQEPEWREAKGLPGTISGRDARGKLPAENQFIWVSFDVNVPQPQTLDLTFSGAVGSHVIVDDANVPVAEKQTTDRVATVPLRLSAGSHRVRVAAYGLANPSELEVRLVNRWDPLAKSKQWLTCSESERLRMLSDKSGPMSIADARDEAAEIDRAIALLEANFTTSLIASELAEPRPTRLLKRGEYDLPVGDPLEPGTLHVMSPFPGDAPRNRLGLARWLTSPEHPLVARVLVNRLWQRTFGEGLVRTPEDFGLQGQQPTHPKLLDWLAVELQHSGWNMKQMLRAMVTSRTFRQSSAWRHDIDDPENRLFARGASYRLDAEVLRDIGLWASGLLDPHMGGEGVKPYQPVGMWAALAHPGSNTKDYKRDSGQLLYRRSLYVYWKRTSPHPMMTLFDAPDRESSCVRRSRTNTPLQSLGMFNETQRIEIARTFSDRLIRDHDNDDVRMNQLFRMLACRDATDQERKACCNLLSKTRERYAAAPTDAAALLAIGEAPRDWSIDAVEHAAWTQLAATVLASDVAILMY